MARAEGMSSPSSGPYPDRYSSVEKMIFFFFKQNPKSPPSSKETKIRPSSPLKDERRIWAQKFLYTARNYGSVDRDHSPPPHHFSLAPSSAVFLLEAWDENSKIDIKSGEPFASTYQSLWLRLKTLKVWRYTGGMRVVKKKLKWCLQTPLGVGAWSFGNGGHIESKLRGGYILGES